MKTQRIEQIATLAAIILLVVGCYVVIRPFLSALLWAAILSFSSWPLYGWCKARLGGRRTLAAMLMTLLVAAVVVAPFVLVGVNLADNVTRLISGVRDALKDGVPAPPSWVGEIPLAGGWLEQAWQNRVADPDGVAAELKQYFDSSKGLLANLGLDIGRVVVQLGLSVFATFFFYRDGAVIAQWVGDVMQRISQDRTQQLIGVVGGTVKGVVYGLLGTALAQGIVAGIGFWIAGVPAALLLGLLTFFFSLVPMGPPLVWLSTSAWLFSNGNSGWGVFILIWGILLISSVDNFIRPYLISRESKLPFLLVFFGVLGGIVAFGFIGIFLGPTLLAVSFSLLKAWTNLKPAAQ